MAKRKTTPRKVSSSANATRRAGSDRRPLRAARASRLGGKLRLPRAAKGKRAQFYQDPAIDQLLGIAVAMTAELSVAFERIHTLERLLAKHGHLDRDELENYEPDDTESAHRATEREALIERVFQVLEVTEPTM